MEDPNGNTLLRIKRQNVNIYWENNKLNMLVLLRAYMSLNG